MGMTEHLTAGQLAGYLDNDLPSDERMAVEEHLDRCAECRAELVELVGITAPAAEGDRDGSRRASRAWWIPAAIAASVAALTLLRPDTPPTVPAPGLERPGAGVFESMPTVIVVTPPDGATASRRDLVFTWRGLGADTYRLTLLTETGELVWTIDTADTAAAVPSSAVLSVGATYFWRVEAIADGISASSGVRRLEISP